MEVQFAIWSGGQILTCYSTQFGVHFVRISFSLDGEFRFRTFQHLMSHHRIMEIFNLEKCICLGYFFHLKIFAYSTVSIFVIWFGLWLFYLILKIALWFGSVDSRLKSIEVILMNFKFNDLKFESITWVRLVPVAVFVMDEADWFRHCHMLLYVSAVFTVI